MNKQPEERLPDGRRQTKFGLNSLQLSFLVLSDVGGLGDGSSGHDLEL
jgi:hypothetical protein